MILLPRLQKHCSNEKSDFVTGINCVTMAETTPEKLAVMAASYRGQSGWLTRAVETCNLVVAEATLRAPNFPLMAQLERCLAKVWDQEQKCAQICEDIRDAQELTAASESLIEASFTRDNNRANAASVAVMQQMARYEIGL
jgi:MOSC domain-containing protein YiiM